MSHLFYQLVLQETGQRKYISSEIHEVRSTALQIQSLQLFVLFLKHKERAHNSSFKLQTLLRLSPRSGKNSWLQSSILFSLFNSTQRLNYADTQSSVSLYPYEEPHSCEFPSNQKKKKISKYLKGKAIPALYFELRKSTFLFPSFLKWCF